MVKGDNMEGKINIDIIDMNGRMVHKSSFNGGENKLISISNLSEGIFIVFIKTRDKIWRRKLIVR
jgi:hypothetical protein